MTRYGNLDYPKLTKGGFLLGVGLFFLGTLSELGLHAAHVQVPAWENALFFDASVLGLAIAFLSPVLFGVVMPLTE